MKQYWVMNLLQWRDWTGCCVHAVPTVQLFNDRKQPERYLPSLQQAGRAQWYDLECDWQVAHPPRFGTGRLSVGNLSQYLYMVSDVSVRTSALNSAPQVLSTYVFIWATISWEIFYSIIQRVAVSLNSLSGLPLTAHRALWQILFK